MIYKKISKKELFRKIESEREGEIEESSYGDYNLPEMYSPVPQVMVTVDFC